jgi:hypothetical protein
MGMLHRVSVGARWNPAGLQVIFLSAGIPIAQLTVRELVDIVAFFLVMLCGIILASAVIRAGFGDDFQDHKYLLVLLTLMFLFQRSEQDLTLGGYALRATRDIVAWLKMEFVDRLLASVF